MGKILNINNGNRFVSLVSMSTPAYGVQDYLQRHNPEHPLADAREKNYACGDVTTSLIKCAGGEVMMLRHNITLPRPYSRANLVQGTRAIYSEDKGGVNIDDVFEHGHWEPMEEIYKKYDHPLWQNYDPSASDGHGGLCRRGAQPHSAAHRRLRRGDVHGDHRPERAVGRHGRAAAGVPGFHTRQVDERPQAMRRRVLPGSGRRFLIEYEKGASEINPARL